MQQDICNSEYFRRSGNGNCSAHRRALVLRRRPAWLRRVCPGALPAGELEAMEAQRAPVPPAAARRSCASARLREQRSASRRRSRASSPTAWARCAAGPERRPEHEAQRSLRRTAVWREYEKMLAYNDSIQLDDTVRVNENFFIGKQWEGVAVQRPAHAGLQLPQARHALHRGARSRADQHEAASARPCPRGAGDRATAPGRRTS